MAGLAVRLVVMLVVGLWLLDAACSAFEPSQPAPTTLPSLNWGSDTSLAVATCVASQVGLKARPESDYREPVARCLKELKPVALEHQDLEFWATCIAHGFGESPWSLGAAASGVEDTCLNPYRYP